MTRDDLAARPVWFRLAGVLALLGLSTAVLYTLRFTPYTMIVFMMAGQGLIALAAACFLGAALWSIRARLRSIEERHYAPGEIVFRQGDHPDRLYVIGQGEVDIVRETPGAPETVLTRLGKDEFFGEIGILSDTPRTATVRAVTDVDVLSIHRSYFTSLFSYLPMFRERVLAAYVMRTRRHDDDPTVE